MQSRWNDISALDAVETYAEKGVSEDLALRVYTTRLLGRDPLLVLHGGGNTSVKTRAKDDLGVEHEVIAVKGSGWDMAEIEPQGMPAVKLEPLRRLRALSALSDEAMVNVQRLNLLDASAPNPSVETLLHAFLPHKFIDHTHAAAVLSIVDQPDGEALAREVYDGRMGIVRYIAPGFGLAKAAAEVFEQSPDVEGLILHKHGIFTFGETAREAYERMIEMVSLAESRLRQGRPVVFQARTLADELAEVAEIAPIIRGAVALPADKPGGEPTRFVMTFRTGPEILAYVNGAELADYSQRGVVTPDHIIRTKNTPLVVSPPEPGRLDEFARHVKQAVAEFSAGYDSYFGRENEKVGGIKSKLDSAPRVVLVPGLGLFGIGRQRQGRRHRRRPRREHGARGDRRRRHRPLRAAAGERSVRARILEPGAGQAEGCGGQAADRAGGAGDRRRRHRQPRRRRRLPPKARPSPSSISTAIRQGRRRRASRGFGLQCDVTKPEEVRDAFAKVCERFGGVDIVVSNAGAAWQGRIGDVSDELLRQSFELNFFAHQTVAKEAVRIMLKQGTGGALLFNLSKQAVNPGANFGPYGLPKAAAMLLMRQYALDYGKDGIRSNGVNADRVRSGLLTDVMIADRAKARGVSEGEYMSGNLLGREVLAEDVAQAFVALAKARKTTGHIEAVDGGNIAAALR